MNTFHTQKWFIFPLASHKSHTLQFGENHQPQARKQQPGRAVMDGAGSQGHNPQEYDPGNQQSHSKRANPGPALTPHTALLNRSCAGIGFTKKLRLKM